MGCKGCKKKAKEFKEIIKEASMSENYKEKENEKQIEHLKKVCVHGVPDGFECKSCKKVISIPEDAVIKDTIDTVDIKEEE